MKKIIFVAAALATLATSHAFADSAARCDGPRSNSHLFCGRETGDNVGRDTNGNGKIDGAVDANRNGKIDKSERNRSEAFNGKSRNKR